MKLELQAHDPLAPVPVLRIEWDPEKGTLEGEHAHLVAQHLTPGGEFVFGPPPGWLHRLSADPLCNPVDMAVVLGAAYILPDDLARHYERAAAPHIAEDDALLAEHPDAVF